MSYSLVWTAVRGKPRFAILEELSFRGTGQHEEIPESPLVGVELPHHWYVIIANKHDPCAEGGILERLSSGCEAVTCLIDECTMNSEATGWKDGRKIWSIWHDGLRAIDHLDAKGDLPSDFDPIRRRVSAEQEKAGGKKAAVDCFFDVPVDVARALTGFHHNEELPGLEGDPYEVLVTESDE